MRRMLLAPLLAVLVWAAPAGAAEERRVALVIGNSAYEHADRLLNPVNDARGIATALRSAGFQVLAGEDLDIRETMDLVGRFERSLAGSRVALVYYSGHGLAVDGVNYLLPIDVKLESRSSLRAQALSVNWLLEDVISAPDRVSIILFDACRTNPFARSFAGITRSTVGSGLTEMRARTGAYIAFATAPGDVAADGTGSYSPFTAALLRHITEPGLEIDGLMKRVRREVYEATDRDQLPWTSSALLGEYYFVPPAAETPRPQQQAALPPAEASVPTPTPGGRDEPAELATLRAAAEQGDADAQIKLGAMYQIGHLWAEAGRGGGGPLVPEGRRGRPRSGAVQPRLDVRAGPRRVGEGRGGGGALVPEGRRTGRRRRQAGARPPEMNARAGLCRAGSRR